MGFSREQYEQFKANLARGKASSAQPQQIVRHDPLGETPREEENPGRIAVRIRSLRQRLLDPDNLCPKYFIDSIRYAKLIPDDSPSEIILEIQQAKVSLRSDERTEIEISFPTETSTTNSTQDP